MSNVAIHEIPRQWTAQAKFCFEEKLLYLHKLILQIRYVFLETGVDKLMAATIVV